MRRRTDNTRTAGADRSALRGLTGLALAVGGLLVGQGAASSDQTNGAGGFQINWYAVDSGGGDSSSDEGPFLLRGTIGQPDAGVMTAGSFVLRGGFWPGIDIPRAQPTCAADLSMDGQVDVTDLLALLSAWGTSDAADIAPEGGDGIVDVLDLLMLLSQWGTCDT